MSLSEAICLVNKEFKIIKISEAKKLRKEDYIYLDNFTKDYLLNDKYLYYKWSENILVFVNASNELKVKVNGYE